MSPEAPISPPASPGATPTPTPTSTETVVDQVIDLANTVIAELRLSGNLNGQATAALQANTTSLNEVKAILASIHNAQVEANTLAKERYSVGRLIADTARGLAEVLKALCESFRSGPVAAAAGTVLGGLGMFALTWLYAHFDLKPPTNNNEPPVTHEPAHAPADDVSHEPSSNGK